MNERTDFDHAAFDVLLPHPQYAAQGWVSVLNPSSLDDLLRDLLREAHGRAVQRAED